MRVTIFSDEVQSFKALITVHKVLQEGHPIVSLYHCICLTRAFYTYLIAAAGTLYAARGQERMRAARGPLDRGDRNRRLPRQNFGCESRSHIVAQFFSFSSCKSISSYITFRRYLGNHPQCSSPVSGEAMCSLLGGLFACIMSMCSVTL